MDSSLHLCLCWNTSWRWHFCFGLQLAVCWRIRHWVLASKKSRCSPSNSASASPRVSANLSISSFAFSVPKSVLAFLSSTVSVSVSTSTSTIILRSVSKFVSAFAGCKVSASGLTASPSQHASVWAFLFTGVLASVWFKHLLFTLPSVSKVSKPQTV